MGKLVFDQKFRVGAWVAEKTDQSSSWGGFYAMGIERDGDLVAGIVLNNHNGANATGHMAIARYDPALPALLHAFFDYCFRQLALKRVTGLVPESNVRMARFTENVGFEHEFVMPCGAPDGGNMIVYVMWPARCAWLQGVKHVRSK